MRSAFRRIRGLALLLLACIASCKAAHDGDGAQRSPERLPQLTPPAVMDDHPRDYPGIHNAVAFHDGFISGSVPEGDAGFDTLRSMGVKTVISVDGAEPDVERAKARGIRYIHLPIGYNGFDEQRRLQLVRAVRDSMNSGAVYIHCHHGRHRSAGAAAAIAASLGWLSPEQGIARMQVSGTAAQYRGLYACAGSATVLDSEVIDDVPAHFSEVWKPSNYVKGMVEIDQAFANLKAIERAGWITPPEHPDLVPAAEAGRLADLFRLLTDDEYVARRPPDFAARMRATAIQCQSLEDLLVSPDHNTPACAAQFRQIANSCQQCHVLYRD